MNIPSVKFNMISPSFDGTVNSYGNKSTNRNYYKFYNFNLKSVLGDLYYNYEYFYLNLIGISNNVSAGHIASNDDYLININVKGFNFQNPTFNNNVAVLGQFVHDFNKPKTQMNDSSNSVIIKPSPENLNIDIYFTTVYGLTPASKYSNFTFYFEITPVL